MRSFLRLILLLGATASVGSALAAEDGASWGTALRFFGLEDRVECREVPGLSGGALTVEFWTKAEHPSAAATFLSYSTEDTCGRELSISHPGALEVALGCESVSTEIDLNDDRWHHLAVTWQGEGGVLRIYVDGQPSFEVEGFQSGYSLPAGGFLVLGQQQECPGGCFVRTAAFRGTMDEVRIWSKVRTAAEIAAAVGDPGLGPAPGLLLAWTMDEGRAGEGYGPWVRDRSGHGHNGWCVNRPQWVPSRWASALVLHGENPWELECPEDYEEPGAEVRAWPVALSVGYAHSLGLRADGTAIGWGKDDAGQRDPKGGLTNLVALAAGARHSLALDDGGQVTAWGDSAWGQASVPTRATNVMAVAAGTLHSLALRRDGSVVGWGHVDSGATAVPEAATNVVAIAAGSQFCLALRAEGVVVAWGSADYGQTRVPPGATNLVAVAARYRHGLGLRADGAVLGWGDNTWGQTNVPSTVIHAVAIAAGYRHSLALLKNGSVVAWGDDSEGQATVPEAATNIVAIAAGGAFSLALRADGTVLGWGRAEDGAISVPEGLFVLDQDVDVEGTVDSVEPGEFLVRYSAFDSSGEAMLAERVVRVVDGVPPMLEIAGEDPVVLEVGGSFVVPEAVAVDGCVGDLTDQIGVSGEVDSEVAGAYRLTYRVADPSGNTNQVDRWVHVVAAPRVAEARVVLTGTAGERSARLEAQVGPEGLASQVVFDYGLSEEYTEATAPIELAAGFGLSLVTGHLLDLTPGATYHYRVTISNALGEATSEDRTFVVPELFVLGDANGDGIVDQGELDEVLAQYWRHGPWPAMVEVRSWGEGTFQFGLTNSTGWDFTVEVATNLVDWQVLGPAYPVYQFRDPRATNAVRRFYRLRSP